MRRRLARARILPRERRSKNGYGVCRAELSRKQVSISILRLGQMAEILNCRHLKMFFLKKI